MNLSESFSLSCSFFLPKKSQDKKNFAKLVLCSFQLLTSFNFIQILPKFPQYKKFAEKIMAGNFKPLCSSNFNQGKK